MEDNKFTNRDAGFHSSNAIQEIRGALKHLVMAAGTNRYIVTKLTEAVYQLTKSNTSLMTKLRDDMRLNLDMDKKLDIKATQVQDPEVKILSDKAKRKAAFERNLDPDGYCWTHGFRVINRRWC